MNRIAKLLAVLALLSAPICTLGADIPITPTGPVFKFQTNPVWGTSGPNGFNNNFFFTPLSQNGSVCVYVKNNNTTNSHTFTASIVVTSDPSNTTPSDGTWQSAATSSGLIAAVSPGLPAGIGVNVSGVSQVSINFSASSTQAGSPETASVTISQTQGNCFAGNQFIGSAPQTIASVTPLQVISEGLSQSFFSTSSVTNPTAGSQLVGVSANSGARTIYFDRVVITSTVVTSVNLNLTINNGTGCTPASVNQKIGSAVTSTSLAGVTCTSGFGINSSIIPSIPIAANATVALDLRGFIAIAGTLNGISTTQVGAPVGNVTVTFFWYEK